LIRPFYLTPPAIGRLLGVDARKVIGWIENGELQAVNCATKPTGRPRWKINPEALRDFERRRAAKPMPRTRRRRRREVVTGEYF
jgi:hypothetical protein